MTASRMMGQEVARIRPRILEIFSCGTCALGIAVDIVGARWGEPESDWRGRRFDHKCKLAEKGPSPSQLERVKKIQVEIETWPRDSAQMSAPF